VDRLREEARTAVEQGLALHPPLFHIYAQLRLIAKVMLSLLPPSSLSARRFGYPNAVVHC
jgi:hypothetical protein